MNLNTKTQWDLLEHSLPNTIRYILTKYPGTALAGGALVSMLSFDSSPPNDWDIFINDVVTIRKIADEYLTPANGATVGREFTSTRGTWFYECTIYGIKIQLIYRGWKEYGEIFGDFDIRLCKQAITFDTTNKNKPEMLYHCTTESANDLFNKQIHLSHIRKNYHNTLLRMLKYEKKGFIIPPETYVKYYTHCSQLSQKQVDAGFTQSTDNRYAEVIRNSPPMEVGQVLTFNRDDYLGWKATNQLKGVSVSKVHTTEDNLKAMAQEEDMNF